MNSEWQPIADWDKLPSLAGVYEIYNSKENMSYIGSAVDLRKRGHYKLLKSGKSHNFKLQRAFDLCGEANFVFRILDLCPEQDPVEIEQRRIDERDFRTLYNLAPIAGSNLGYCFSHEQTAELSRSKIGVPKSPETKKAAWLKRTERGAKAIIYTRLSKAFKKGGKYRRLLGEIEAYLRSGPGWGRPISLSIGETKEMTTLRWDFQSWWILAGGREYADKKYGFSCCAWRYMSSTQAELYRQALSNCATSRSDTVHAITESIVNEQLSADVELEYAEAVASGKVNFDYSPASPVDLDGFLEMEGVQLYGDGSVRSLSQTTGNLHLYQEWYESGLPKVALIENTLSTSVEKRAWSEEGKPEYIIQYLQGQFHGVICKWDHCGGTTYAARFEKGREVARLEDSRMSFESVQPVLERPPKGTREELKVKLNWRLSRISNGEEAV